MAQYDNNGVNFGLLKAYTNPIPNIVNTQGDMDTANILKGLTAVFGNPISSFKAAQAQNQAKQAAANNQPVPQPNNQILPGQAPAAGTAQMAPQAPQTGSILPTASSPGQATQTPVQGPSAFLKDITDNVNPNVDKFAAAITNNESGGNYNATSIPSKNGDRAYGKYQIMGNNIPAWSKEALGKSVTTKEYLASPEIQEKVAGFQFNKMLNSGLSPEDAASTWFSGRPVSKAGNAKDAYGTSVPQYVAKFSQYYNS